MCVRTYINYSCGHPGKILSIKDCKYEGNSRDLLKRGVSESDPQILLNNENCFKSVSIVYRKYKRKCVPCKNKGRDPRLLRITEEDEPKEGEDNMAEEEEGGRKEDLAAS